MPLPLVTTIAVVWAGLMVFGIPFAWALCRARARQYAAPPARPRRLAPDPAFADRALSEDERWEGIESEWHEFVDGLPEVQR